MNTPEKAIQGPTHAAVTLTLAHWRYEFFDAFGAVTLDPYGAVKARERATGIERRVRVIVVYDAFGFPVVDLGDEMVVLQDRRATMTPATRREVVDAAEAWGSITGRYKDRWPDLCESLGLPSCGFSLVSLEAVLDLLMERVPR